MAASSVAPAMSPAAAGMGWRSSMPKLVKASIPFPPAGGPIPAFLLWHGIRQGTGWHIQPRLMGMEAAV